MGKTLVLCIIQRARKACAAHDMSHNKLTGKDQCTMEEILHTWVYESRTDIITIKKEPAAVQHQFKGPSMLLKSNHEEAYYLGFKNSISSYSYTPF